MTYFVLVDLNDQFETFQCSEPHASRSDERPISQGGAGLEMEFFKVSPALVEYSKQILDILYLNSEVKDLELTPWKTLLPRDDIVGRQL